MLLKKSDRARTEPVEKIKWSAYFQSARSVGSMSFAGRDARAPAKKQFLCSDFRCKGYLFIPLVTTNSPGISYRLADRYGSMEARYSACASFLVRSSKRE